MPSPNRFFHAMLLFIIAATAAIGQPNTMNSAEIKLALQKLNCLGSVLYIAAHPDDENTAFLAYAAKGRHLRTAYLSVTRGEGGQNLLGTEQGDLMGVIRTKELLAARSIDGAEQFFTRAIDFGFSKTTEETIQKWGGDRILADMVWIIRSFQPDVIVTRFTPTLGGHGNHTASALLAYRAFMAAADPSRFPEQLRLVDVWQSKRLVWNVFRFQQNEGAAKPDSSVEIDVGAFNQLLGKSFSEIAGESRSMHKSQGFGAGQNRGAFVNYFKHVAGDLASGDLFDGVNTTWSRIPGTDTISSLVRLANERYSQGNPSSILVYLLRAHRLLQNLPDNIWVRSKKAELEELIKACSGLWIDVWSSERYVAPGGELKATTSVINRSPYPFSLIRLRYPWGADTAVTISLKENQTARIAGIVRVPVSVPPSVNFWLRKPSRNGFYEIQDSLFIGRSENPTPWQTELEFESPEGRIRLQTPVRFRSIDPVKGEVFRPVEVVPPVSLSISDKVVIFPDQSPKRIEVLVRSYVRDAVGVVNVISPPGWEVRYENRGFRLAGVNEEHVAKVLLVPGPGAASGECSVQTSVNGMTVKSEIKTIEYSHIVPAMVLEDATLKLLRIDLKHRGQNIGYIMGAGDEIPKVLRQVGFSVTMLSDEELAESDLLHYDAIIAGVRAYNTRPRLRLLQSRMMDYVRNGGNYVVQYVTPQRGESENLGPYPFTVSRERVTVEEASVAFPNPDHPILRWPNRITSLDFSDWTQERGLYFADIWDRKYDSVLVSADPGESPRAGGMLSARYGSGIFTYTGYAFFRQLPAGVPGAIRLFTNLVSQVGVSPRTSNERPRRK